MATKIRLTRMGSRHHPFFRLVVTDSRCRRDGRFVEILGHYNPLTEPAEVAVHREEALEWLMKGAQPTDTAKSLLKETGVWQKFQLIRQGKTVEQADSAVAELMVSRKAQMKVKEFAESSKASVTAKAVVEVPAAPVVESNEG